VVSVQAIVTSFELRNPTESQPIEITQIIFQSASQQESRGPSVATNPSLSSARRSLCHAASEASQSQQIASFRRVSSFAPILLSAYARSALSQAEQWLAFSATLS
jgi:hypothetical protein